MAVIEKIRVKGGPKRYKTAPRGRIDRAKLGKRLFNFYRTASRLADRTPPSHPDWTWICAMAEELRQVLKILGLAENVY